MESERDRKIRERAYELWVQGGRSEDSHERDWLQAEQEHASGAGSESPDVSVTPISAAKKAPKAKPVSAKPSGGKSAAPAAAAKRTSKTDGIKTSSKS